MKRLAYAALSAMLVAPAFADWSRPLDRGGRISDTITQLIAFGVPECKP